MKNLIFSILIFIPMISIAISPEEYKSAAKIEVLPSGIEILLDGFINPEMSLWVLDKDKNELDKLSILEYYEISPNKNSFLYSNENGIFLYEINTQEKIKVREYNISDQEYYDKYLSKNTKPYEYRILDYPKDEEENIVSIGWSPNSKKILIVSEFSEAHEVFYCIHDIDNFENPECRSRGIQAVYVSDDERFEISNEGKISVKNSVYPEIDNKKISPFTDLPPTHPLYNHILQAVDDGWINGYPDNTIQLDKTVNRAEFAKIIMLALAPKEADDGIPKPVAYPDFEDLSHFPDVERDTWYIPFLAKAVRLDVMKGYPDGTIKPAQTINTAEALKMALTIADKDIPNTSGEWFEKYRVFAVKNLNLSSLSLEVSNMSTNITRGMAIELISALKNLNQ